MLQSAVGEGLYAGREAPSCSHTSMSIVCPWTHFSLLWNVTCFLVFTVRLLPSCPYTPYQAQAALSLTALWPLRWQLAHIIVSSLSDFHCCVWRVSSAIYQQAEQKCQQSPHYPACLQTICSVNLGHCLVFKHNRNCLLRFPKADVISCLVLHNQQTKSHK